MKGDHGGLSFLLVVLTIWRLGYLRVQPRAGLEPGTDRVLQFYKIVKFFKVNIFQLFTIGFSKPLELHV